MSLVDTLKGLFGKGQQYAAENADKVEGAIDKAGDFIDQKTGGKYAEHVDKAQDAAKKVIPKDAPPAGDAK
ncbi:antitoxin [Rhodococcus sp. NPDC058505]|uniref:antitoxin n=1 Tax=unclassified Rhodococcus (in: high G+C Gram-positive bacteria) TaxID=192944 RepID=UPI003663DB5D